MYTQIVVTVTTEGIALFFAENVPEDHVTASQVCV